MSTTTLIVTDERGRTATRHASLTAAVDAAVMVRRVDPQAGLRFELAEGTHRLHASLVLPPAISGTEQDPTVFAPEAGANVVISGAHPVTPRWRDHRDGIVVTTLEEAGFDQLWVDGERQVRARYPNADPTQIPFLGTAADALSAERTARWADPTGGEIHAMHEYRWGSVFVGIDGRNDDQTLRLGAMVGNNRVIAPDPSALHPDRVYVENILEELDAPGEWFFDQSARELYFLPPEGLDLTTSTVAVTALQNLIEVSASNADPVHDVRFEGLTIAHAARSVMAATERMLRSDWSIARTGALLLEGAVRFEVTDCDFRDLGGTGIFVSGFNEGVTVTGCSFTDLGGSGVQFAGRMDAVRTPVVGYHNGLELDAIDRTPGPQSEAFPRDCRVHDCLITRIGVTDKQAAGVGIDIAARVTVSCTSIYDVPRAGINIGNGTFGGHILEHNDVFDTVQESNDHGSFNSWGRDRYWHPDLAEMRRRVAAEPALAFLDVVEPIVIRHNRWRTDNGFDVDLDDGSSRYVISDNLMLKGGLKLREGFERIVTNNVIINNGLHPHVSFPGSGDVFRRNIVMGPYQPILVDVWDGDFDDNLFTHQKALDAAQTLGSDRRSVVADPGFVDPERGDFRVADDSPAVALGFVSFSMDFGVLSPRLRAVARTPQIPVLLSSLTAAEGTTYDLSGAVIKSIETLAEQSAVGSDDQGALVVSVRVDSLADLAGLRAYDVIKSVEISGESFPVDDAPLLLILRASHTWQERLHVTVLRDHRLITTAVPYE